MPDVMWSNVTVRNNLLTSLEYGPTKVGGDFICSNNYLKSLEFGPTSVGRHYFCSLNNLKTLVGAPSETFGDFSCSQNHLTSLEGVPMIIRGNLTANKNNLTSLKGIHKQIKQIDGSAFFEYNPIRSHVLGLLKIKNLIRVYLTGDEIEDIVNKYLKGDKDIFACQEELIEAGYPEFAQL
jgi:hypothetical protein